MFLDVGGNIYPNCTCVEEIGNINENSIAYFWNSKAMQEYRKGVFEGENCSLGCANICPDQHNYKV